MTNSLRSHHAALEELWKQGHTGHELLLRYTELADSLTRELFEKAVEEHGVQGEAALIAVGGYGRREQYPYSDIDLLLLHDGKAGKKISTLAESILYPLWDEGLDVGHSVRTVKDAVSFAQEDFVFQVALLDARLIAGAHSLFEELKKLYTQKIYEGRRAEFVSSMERARRERREKFGSHAYLLEPHIKEGKGGLRDIQSMLWVAKGVFGLPDLEAVESSAMISQEDRESLKGSWNMLSKIRNRLHYLRRRKDDQLIFEFQEEMAGAFGYEDQNGVLAVEHFMRDVYGHLQTVAVVTDLFFEHVHEILGINKGGEKERKLERAIAVRGDRVRLTAEDKLNDRPYLIMRLFLQAGRTGCPLHHRTQRIVAANLHLVDDAFRRSKRVSAVFRELLMEGGNIFSVLESMLATGVLPLYLPEFASIESLAQHDLYHLYTVDRHLLQTVAELQDLREEMADLFGSLPDPDVLFLAALLHDVGKGKHTDHSERGAAMVEAIAGRLCLSEEQGETLSFLVRYHLFLPENAMRRDLSDPGFIQQTAELIGDVHRLTMLYLLTIADSKATGPSAWSSWKSSLLLDLYLQVKACLEAGCHSIQVQIDESGQGVEWLREQLEERLAKQDAMSVDAEILPDDYLLGFSLETVLEHLALFSRDQGRLQQQVVLFPTSGNHCWSLLIMSKDRPGLLAKICGVLAINNISVLAAQIFTWLDGTVVDVLEVTSSVGEDFDDQNWQVVEQEFNQALTYRFDVGSKLHNKSRPIGMGPTRKVQQSVRKVVIDNETSTRFTIIEVYGDDSYAGLYHLTQTLADFNLSIHRAQVATEVEQLIDVFYVTTGAGEKLTDPEVTGRLRYALLKIIGQEREEQSLIS